MTTPSFSRLKLAAALIEYDNDSDDEEGPVRSARESAIFAHTRGPPTRPTIASLYMQNEGRSSTDFLGVKMPSEVDATSQFSRHRRSSVMDPEYDQQEKEEKVDLDSWGMSALKGDRRDDKDEEDEEEDDAFREPERRRAVSEFLPNPHSPLDDTFQRPNRVSFARSEFVPATSRPQHSRSTSLGDFGAGGAFLDSPRTSLSGGMPLSAAGGRRKSLDLDTNIERNEGLHDAESGAGVPFPTAETPADDLNNPFALALPPPSPGRSSRFDPKSYGGYEGHDRARTMSRASMGSTFMFNGDDRRSFSTGMMLDDGRSVTGGSMYFDADDGRSRRMSRISRFDDDTRSRRLSQLEGDGRPRVMSRVELLRPKVLVMPSPLQAGEKASPVEAGVERPGFLVSKDGPPLPPGAKTERPGPRPLSGMGLSQSYYEPPTSTPFTPNPRQSLTLSQLTFRNSLMKDVSFTDMGLRKAADEGEKVTQEVLEEEEEPVNKGPTERLPGRLYGHSLIDSLEERKAQLRSKKRVFTGDNRPSMMERPQLQRSSTLIDPAAFEDKRNSAIARRSSSLAESNRRYSSAPLLQFETEDTLKSPIDPGPDFRRMTKTKSTFGVDQIWEKELAKLQLIEAEERRLAEEDKRKEEEREAKKSRKLAKGKGVPGHNGLTSPTSPHSGRSITGKPLETSPTTHIPLPVLQTPSFLDATHRRQSVISLGAKNWFSNSSDEDEESDSGAELLTPRKPKAYSKSASASILTMDDTTPTKARAAAPRATIPEDAEDDEDVPLAAHLQKLKISGPHLQSDSEEDVPLAAVLTRRLQGSSSSKPASSPRGAVAGSSPKPPSFSPSHPSPKPPSFAMSQQGALPLPTFDFGDNKSGFAASLGLDLSAPPEKPASPSTTSLVAQETSDDDDVPLGMRHPGVVVLPDINDEDEAPLGMRFPTAATRQHQQAAALQQQQYMLMMQQQLMWQTEAQIRNSMVFPTAPSMMGMPSLPATPFGMPPAPGMPFMPNPNPPMPVQPALTDPGKYNRVDRWRRDVSAIDPPA